MRDLQNRCLTDNLDPNWSDECPSYDFNRFCRIPKATTEKPRWGYPQRYSRNHATLSEVKSFSFYFFVRIFVLCEIKKEIKIISVYLLNEHSIIQKFIECFFRCCSQVKLCDADGTSGLNVLVHRYQEHIRAGKWWCFSSFCTFGRKAKLSLLQIGKVRSVLGHYQCK